MAISKTQCSIESNLFLEGEVWLLRDSVIEFLMPMELLTDKMRRLGWLSALVKASSTCGIVVATEVPS